MAEIPYDLHTSGFGRTEHRQQRRPVVPAGNSLDLMPTHSIAGGPDFVLAELLVVLECEQVMARRSYQVEPTTVPATMRRTTRTRPGKSCGTERGEASAPDQVMRRKECRPVCRVRPRPKPTRDATRRTSSQHLAVARPSGSSPAAAMSRTTSVRTHCFGVHTVRAVAYGCAPKWSSRPMRRTTKPRARRNAAREPEPAASPQLVLKPGAGRSRPSKTAMAPVSAARRSMLGRDDPAQRVAALVAQPALYEPRGRRSDQAQPAGRAAPATAKVAASAQGGTAHQDSCRKGLRDGQHHLRLAGDRVGRRTRWAQPGHGQAPDRRAGGRGQLALVILTATAAGPL